LWGGKKLPANRWIGMKYILVNVNNNTDVRLRVYIDSVSSGNSVDGGVWTLVGDIIDDGTNWQGADISGCTYTDKFMPITAGGNVYMRTDNDTAVYKMVTIREIDLTVTGTNEPSIETIQSGIALSDDQTVLTVYQETPILQCEITNMVGQVQNVQRIDAKTWNIASFPSGTFLLRATTKEGMFTKKFVLSR